ncbi:MAG: hypothetical protein RL094_123 [Candidatus Parcubacteria bacterium]|jgi:hypothetical protein
MNRNASRLIKKNIATITRDPQGIAVTCKDGSGCFFGHDDRRAIGLPFTNDGDIKVYHLPQGRVVAAPSAEKPSVRAQNDPLAHRRHKRSGQGNPRGGHSGRRVRIPVYA